MIRTQDLKPGDIILAEYDGQRAEGEVIELAREDKEVCVRTAVQDFWFSTDQLFPILLDNEQLLKFGFERQEFPGGGVKYLFGPFRILLAEKDNFSFFEMWYREDRRHITEPMSVHELQNHYRQMTKVELVRAPGVQAG